MRFRKPGPALLACMAVSCVAAAPAQAGWTIGTPGNILRAGAHETVDIDKAAGTEIALTGTVLGAPIKIMAEGVHCAAGFECTIDGSDHSTATLEFTGVTVAEPSSYSANNVGQPVGKVVPGRCRR